MAAALDQFGIMSACMEVQNAWLTHPVELYDAMNDYWCKAIEIPLQAYRRALGGCETGFVELPSEFDERFQDPIWCNNPVSDCLKESYLLTTRWLEDNVYATPGVPDKIRRRAGFWVRQSCNAISPTNCFWLNPKAMSTFFESGGKSLLRGTKMLCDDALAGTVRMVPEHAFQVGKNLAITPGKVVFRNDMIELIQYQPTTEKVHQMPLVFVPPWINRYYILDLTPEKSMVHYLVSQGYTVFMISWKNPTPAMSDVSFEDFIFKGAYEAVKVAREICQVPAVHIVGYCIGGLAVSCLMAWLNGRSKNEKKDMPIAHATLFASLTDYSNPGEVDIFIDEQCIQDVEAVMDQKGFLGGDDLEKCFRFLRSNSLIWHYVVTRYLYGEEPPPVDLLYWNTNGTRLPKKMHSYYLREMYLHNKLKDKGAIVMKDIPLNLGNITQPFYVVGAEQDHITPWKETFKTCHLIKGPVRYVLATSGHIIGILSVPVNPPKRRYWAGDATGQTDATAWCEKQPKALGSWWEDWSQWLSDKCGELQVPPSMGNASYPVLLDAPGTYVLEN
jgi:polyhydroxyalkanoate synthase